MRRVSKSGRFDSSGDHVSRVVVLRAVVTAAEFELVSFRFNGKWQIFIEPPSPTAVTGSDVVVLSAGLRTAFNCCGGDTHVGEIGLATRGKSALDR